MGTAGRGFPVFTPSPASSAASGSMSTADFGANSHGFPPFQERPPSPPPQDTASGGGQPSTLQVPISGIPTGGEDGEIPGESAFSQRPRGRIRRSELTPMGQVPPPAQQESRDTQPGVTASSESRYHSEEGSLHDQQDYEARSHYGPGGRGVAGLYHGGSPPSMVIRPPLPVHTVVPTGGGFTTQGVSSQTLSSPSRGVPDQTVAAVPALVVPISMKRSCSSRWR